MPPLLGYLALGTTALATSVNAQHWPLPEGYHRFAPRTAGFKWGTCVPVRTSRECSRFEVPLDWANPAAGKASLAVARYKATKQPKLGTLFVNPGGPGGSGVDMVLSGNALKISEASGGQYDIVSWDPRGIGKTVPRAECFTTGTEENAFWEGTIPRAGLEARGNFTDQGDIDAFYEQVDEVDHLLTQLGQKCVAYSPDTFQYIGTAAAVRDMIAMHDILEGSDKPVHYWGFSYGTVVGIYLVNMFPERVGRVVLDGVVDPELWANNPSYQKWAVKPESTDEAFTGFLKACATAGPSRCAIANKDSSEETLRKYVSDLIDAAYDYKRRLGPRANFGSSYVRSRIFRGMYSPSSWPTLALELAEVANEVLDSANHETKRSLPTSPIDMQSAVEKTSANADPAPDYAFQGVTCADALDAGNTTTKDVFDFLVHVTRTVSPMFGPSWGDGGFYCHRWPVRAVERYTGPWNKTLANPILVIGNKADPVTPYVVAKKVADALGDSAALIQQDDYGHTSLAMHSNCTIAALQNYFLDNKLPTHELHCGTDQPLFPGSGLTVASLDKLHPVSNSTSTSNTSSSHGELGNALQRNCNLLIATIALAAATGLVLIVSLVSRIHRRYKLESAYGAYIHPGASEKTIEESGHTHGPYVLSAEIKSGGYPCIGA
ncbi:putative hydrolase [Rhizoctonia solani 123E]|uniref:Putative hydrolase n=1 Tax=Rhizoctonia solani 123E TaxID=1423351 RepID=A0A074RQK3_9AGAM|nr:putative hydrolase [Rhizoctonia solani 123E]